MVAHIVNTLASAQIALGEWSLSQLFGGAQKSARTIGGYLIVLLGIVCVVWGAVLLAKKLLTTQDQTKWSKVILLLFIGGVLAVGGFSTVAKVSSGANKEVTTMGDSGKAGQSENGLSDTIVSPGYAGIMDTMASLEAQGILR